MMFQLSGFHFGWVLHDAFFVRFLIDLESVWNLTLNPKLRNPKPYLEPWALKPQSPKILNP